MCNNGEMQIITRILPYAQIIVSVILVASILLQQSGAGVGGALGGGDGGSFHHTRRGFEKFLFYLSIVLGILLAVLAFLAILIKAKS
jgi:protein translocase SecG subunit